MPDTKTSVPSIHHEHWCQPTGGRAEVRVEQGIAYMDMPNGKSVPAKRVTRCLECGEARYDDL